MNKYNELTLEALKHYQNVLIKNNEVHQMDDIETLSKIINHLKK